MVINKSQTKAQIKIQQMAFMIIAVFIFFILVALFVLSFSLSGLKRSATALEEQSALAIVTKLANSPEFSCGEAYGNMVNCIDSDKVMVLKESIDKYSTFWGGISNIMILKFTGENVECTRGSYMNCRYIDVFSRGAQGYPVENFITLCRKTSDDTGIYDKCEIAKLIIYYNEKQ